MSLTLFNTLSHKREAFVPLHPPRVTMYVCGPTVYSYAHIGNARPPVVFDVLARLLRRDYQLTYARNITDVDDKINAAAADEGVDISVVTNRYLAAYHEDLRALGVQDPDVEPRVTDHLDDIIRMIQQLISSKHAYEAQGHVLFAVESFSDYGILSRRSIDEMMAGARVEVAPYKRAPGDFVLWKPSPPDVVGWASPWGRGRPGWHIECSAMAEKHLGETLDIHGGGQDLVFPHHENEVAQSTCAHGGSPYCRYWVHNGFVNMGSEKMAKSLGNVLLVKDLVRQHPGEVIRLALLSAHYRQPLDWTPRLLDESTQRLDRLYGVLRDAGLKGEFRPTAVADVTAGADQSALEPVVAALEEDLNTPQALAALAALARSTNRCEDPQQRSRLAATLRAGAWYMGLLGADPEAWFARTSQRDEDPDADRIDALVEQRVKLRAAGDFAAADRIRDELVTMGVQIEDGPAGTRWRRG